MKRQRNLFPFAIIVALALGSASRAQAGFDSKGGMSGTGYQIGGVTPTGDLPPAARSFVDKIKAQESLNEADARARAILIHKNICNAIEQVKKLNPTVGKCLALLKEKGKICVSFDAQKNCAGACQRDGKAGCTENDPMNINVAYTGTNCLPTYGAVMIWLTSTLLHEGTHAGQDYGTGTPNADASKEKAAKNKKRACNEVEAHGTGVSWYMELLDAADKLRMHKPVNPAASDATKQIYKDIDGLPEPDRTAAIDAMAKAAKGGKKSDEKAVACYTKAKEALQKYIDADISTPEKKAAALEELKKALNDDTWKAYTSHYEVPRIILSDGESGDVEQIDGDADFILHTGMNAIMDFLLSDDEHTLLVSGKGLLPGTASLYAYVDANGNGLFETGERVVVYENSPLLQQNLSLIQNPATRMLYVFDQAAATIWKLNDLNGDGVPEGLCCPAFVSPTPLDATLRWFFGKDNQTLYGYDFIDNLYPGFSDTDEVMVLRDFDGDGTFEAMEPMTERNITDVAPAWLGNVFVGQNVISVTGDLDHQILLFAVGPDFQPVEVLGQTHHNVPSGTAMPLLRPLRSSDQLILLDPQLSAYSPVFSPQLHIFQITHSPSSVALAWGAQPGKTYRVQFKDTLNANSWSNLTTDVPASGIIATKTDSTIGTRQQRFYRVEELP